MGIKRFISIIICFMIVLPSFVKTVSCDEAVSLCLDGGISGYYLSVSKMAYNMCDAVFRHLFDVNALKTSKYISSKKDTSGKQSENDTANTVNFAVLIDDNVEQIFKTDFFALSLSSSEALNHKRSSDLSGDDKVGFAYWMILFISLLILPIRKKDNKIIMCDIFADMHPVLS